MEHCMINIKEDGYLKLKVMTKKHFIAVAKEIKRVKELHKDNEEALNAIMEIQIMLSNLFADSNPLFKPSVFNAACNV